eukprot:c14603_g1_i3 orf=74-256(+)
MGIIAAGSTLHISSWGPAGSDHDGVDSQQLPKCWYLCWYATTCFSFFQMLDPTSRLKTMA